MALTPEVVDARFHARSWENRARLLELQAKSGEVERRDPTAATQSLNSYQTPGTPMVARWDAGQALRMAYMANVIVWRCMNIVANVAAACPFRAGDQIPEQPGQVVPHNRNARLAQLLGPPPGGPAPKLTARRLMAWTVVQRRVTGRYGWEVETSQPRGKGEVAALWPLVSANLQAVPSESGTDWFTRFLYGPQGQPDAKLRTLTPDQIVYGWDPSAEDFRQPESCLQAARLDVSIAVMSDRYAYGFLRNDARPAAIVVTEAFESDEAYRAFKSNWYGEFGGPTNAGKSLFAELPDDASYKPSEAVFVQTLGLSQKQAQFMEQHQASLERVAIACGVPWSRLSAADRTFDNASEENENFWYDTMLPLLADLADEINMQLAPRVGGEVGWFDLSHVKVFQPQRRFTSFQDAKFALDEEVATRNEVREEVGWAPVEGGDEFRRPATQYEDGETVPQVVAPDAIVEPLELPSAAGASFERRTAVIHSHWHTHADGTIHRHMHRHRDGVADHDDWAQVVHSHSHPETLSIEVGERRDMLAQYAEAMGYAVAHIQQRDALSAQERRARTWRAHDATVRTLEVRTAKTMRRLFGRQRKAVLSRLEGNRGRRTLADGTPNVDELYDRAFWQSETVDDAEAVFEAIATAGFARIGHQFGISFDVAQPYAQQFIQDRANQLAGLVTDTTYTAIKDTLAQGAAAGESIPDLAARIRAVFDEADTNRSVTIARTEVNSAMNASVALGAAQLPSDVAGGQEWISTLDDRTRDDHAEADGQIVAIDEAFSVGGEQLSYPGDPNGSPDNTINCRCTVGILTPDEMPAADQEAAAAAPGEQRVSEAAALSMLGELTSAA